MFGHRREPAELTGESMVHPFGLKSGRLGPDRPLSEIMDREQIDFLNGVQKLSGVSLDLILPSKEASFSVDTTTPDAQALLAGLDARIKQSIEERGGKQALQRAVDENGDLIW
jgi:hypothetical protein